ncbi:uncharacterized LOC128031834 homolog [Pan troglodytes]|uniref:uncharacterized LOC128031834 homolog n=1 Tax=Pan troglodytes TaxID=9598 RepID=UPI0023F4F1B6|nr:uncharacterized LOC128031834 homolog isoform X2 [Pan troglodytes]XP_003318251.2 uncharacterized LOC128031834 homolog isoform X2 [Pan troglodytes]
MLLGGCWGPPTGSAIGCAGGRGAAGDTAAAAGLDRATAATAAATDPPPPPLFPCSSFFLLFSFPAGPRPLSLTAASILRKGMTSWHRRENRVQAQKLFPHHHLLKN